MTSDSCPSRRAMIGAVTGAVIFQLLISSSALAGSVARPGCLDRCGDISVPYPFGIGDGCFYKDEEGFNLTCDGTRSPPKLFLGDSTVTEVLDISASDSTVRVVSNLLRSASAELSGTWSVPTGPFVVSSMYNWFIAFGCNIFAQLSTFGFSSTCGAMCADVVANSSDEANSICSPLGHCRASVMLSAPSYSVNVTPLFSAPVGSQLHKGNIAAFIAEKSWFSIYGGDIGLSATPAPAKFGVQTVPVVLEWSLSSNWTCIGSIPRNYSVAIQVNNNNVVPRIQCICPSGYTGNPYLANGCQEDIDECQKPDKFLCPGGTCINLPGSFLCSPTRKSSMNPGLVAIIVISASSGLVFSLLGVTKTIKRIKKQRAKKLRKKFFKINHGLLLQQLISSNEDIAEKLKIFSLEELEQATNKFDQNRILGGGCHGTVYKGILSDQRVVAIKKSNIVVKREIDEFINEVVILSQTNHRNVVKLFGCCLETEVPLLVYEFISNGTLAYHLHGQIENPL